MLTVLSPAEFEALEQGGAKMAALTSEETQTMGNDGGYDGVGHSGTFYTAALRFLVALP